MTTKLPPGAPKLEWDGEESGDDTLSDSAWEDLPDESPEDKTRNNLSKIAKAKRREQK